MIQFPCPTCDELLDVEDCGAGQNKNCPACGTRLQIPMSTPTPVLRLALRGSSPTPRQSFLHISPAWFFAVTAFVYATGFLAISLFHDSYGLRALDDSLFKLRYAHIGILCLAIPAILAFSTYAIRDYWEDYCKGRVIKPTEKENDDTLRSERFGKRPHPVTVISITIVALVFYLILIFAPPNQFRKIETQAILLASVVLVYLWRDISINLAEKQKPKNLLLIFLFISVTLILYLPAIVDNQVDHWKFEINSLLILLPLLISLFLCAFKWEKLSKSSSLIHTFFALRLFIFCALFYIVVSDHNYWDDLFEMFSSVNDILNTQWYFSTSLIIGFLAWSIPKRAKRGQRLWQAFGALVIGLVYFFSVIVFGYRIYHYIPAGKGGGDFTASPLIRVYPTNVSTYGFSINTQNQLPLTQNNNPFPDWVFEKELVVIDGTSTSIFVADPEENGGPETWRKKRNCRPIVVEIPRSAIAIIEYNVELYKKWKERLGYQNKIPPCLSVP